MCKANPKIQQKKTKQSSDQHSLQRLYAYSTNHSSISGCFGLEVKENTTLYASMMTLLLQLAQRGKVWIFEELIIVLCFD